MVGCPVANFFGNTRESKMAIDNSEGNAIGKGTVSNTLSLIYNKRTEHK
jgi:hypothetical protein